MAKIPPPPADPKDLGGAIPPPPADPSMLQDAPHEMTTREALMKTGKELGARALNFTRDNLLPTAGAVTTAAEAAELAAPLGPVGMGIAAVGGAYIGGAAGTAATEGAKAITPGEPAKTAGQVAESVNEGGKTMAEAEMLGQAGVKSVERAAGYFLPALEKRAPNVVKAVRAAMAKDILPSITQVTQSKAMATLEEIASKAPIVGPRIIKMRQAQEAAYDALRTHTLEQAGADLSDVALGTQTRDKAAQFLDQNLAKREAQLAKDHKELLAKNGPEKDVAEMGRELNEVRAQRTELARREASQLYTGIDQAIPDAKNSSPATNIRRTAEEIHSEYARLDGDTYKSNVPGEVEDLRKGPSAHVIEEDIPPIQAKVTKTDNGLVFTNVDDSAASEYIKKRNGYTYQELQTLRSSLGTKIREAKLADPTGTSPKVMNLTRLKEATDQDLSGLLKEAGPEVEAMKKAADANYAIYKGRFANQAMKTLGTVAREHPESVYKVFMKPNNASDIARLKAVVGEDGFAPLRQRFVRDLVTGPNGEVLGGSDILKNVAKQGSTLKEALTPGQVTEVMQYAKTRPVMGQGPEGKLPQFLEAELERKVRSVVMSGNNFRTPEDIVKHVVNGDESVINALHQVVGPEGMEPYRRKVLESIIGKPAPADALTGLRPPPNALRVDKNLEAYGTPALKAMGFTDKSLGEIRQIESIKGLLESQQRLQANYAGTASTLIAGGTMAELVLHPVQAGAFVFHNPVTAAAAVISPEILSRFYVSEAGRKLLIEGMSPEAIGNAKFAARFSAYLGEAVAHHESETGHTGIQVIPYRGAQAGQEKTDPQAGQPNLNTSTMSDRTRSILGY